VTDEEFPGELQVAGERFRACRPRARGVFVSPNSSNPACCAQFYPRAQLESDLAREVFLLPSVSQIIGAANEPRDILVQQLER
jgi:hypothetical protein